MATCRKQTITPEPPPEEFVLTLSRSEAYTLATAIFRGPLWGDTQAGDVLRNIWNVLDAAGSGTGPTELFDFCAEQRPEINPNFDPDGWKANG